jgi:hypothetical protein
MGQRTERIEGELQDERDELRANLDELRDRVRSTTDWRRQFRDHPGLALGLAFGGGLLLASLLRPRASGVRSYPQHEDYAPRRPATGELRPNAWKAIQGALIGVAASNVRGALHELAAGLREHLAKTAESGRAGESGSNGHDAQGEGNYEAARRYRAGAERYVRSAGVGAAAPGAAPSSAAEAEEPEAAEDAGRSRAKRP